MKQNKFTVAALIAATITAAPIVATGVTVLSAAPVMAATKGSSDVHKMPGTFVVTVSKANVRTSQGGLTGKTLKKNSSWRVLGEAFFLGQTYYDLGGDQYVAASTGKFYGLDNSPFTKQPGKVTIVYNGAKLVTSNKKPIKDAKGHVKLLKRGSTWKVFGYQFFSDEAYYNLGGNQWVDSQYLKFHK